MWLESGRDISDPDWVPLLRPTPSHPDYTSTHATFGGAGATVLKFFNKGDKINAAFSSNVTLDAQGVITRRYRSIDQASYENARSRIYGGVSPIPSSFWHVNQLISVYDMRMYTYAGTEGIKLGEAVAEETLRLFDDHWDKF